MAKMIQAFRHTWEKADDDGNRIDKKGHVENVDENFDADNVATESAFYTQPNGEGDHVHSVKSAGRGKYYVYRMKAGETPVLDDAQKAEITKQSFMAIMLDKDEKHPGRLRKALEALDAIRKTAKSHKSKDGAPWTPEQAANIMARIMGMVNAIEGELATGTEKKGKEVIDTL